jgi:hypothetical protein
VPRVDPTQSSAGVTFAQWARRPSSRFFLLGWGPWVVGQFFFLEPRFGIPALVILALFGLTAAMLTVSVVLFWKEVRARGLRRETGSPL